MGAFTDVAGQTVTVNRPPKGYVTIVDHEGIYRFVSVAALKDAGPGFIDIVLRDLAELAPATLDGDTAFGI